MAASLLKARTQSDYQRFEEDDTARSRGVSLEERGSIDAAGPFNTDGDASDLMRNNRDPSLVERFKSEMTKDIGVLKQRLASDDSSSAYDYHAAGDQRGRSASENAIAPSNNPPAQAPPPPPSSSMAVGDLTVKCTGCRRTLSYPPNALTIKCPMCSEMLSCPPPGSAAPPVSMRYGAAPQSSAPPASSGTMTVTKCTSCSSTIKFPSGSARVQCPVCKTISSPGGAPPQSMGAMSYPPASIQQHQQPPASMTAPGAAKVVYCSGCRASIMFPSHLESVQCPGCSVITLTAVKCNQCALVMSCNANSPAFSCPSCKTVNTLNAQPPPSRAPSANALPPPSMQSGIVPPTSTAPGTMPCTGCRVTLKVPPGVPAMRCPRCSTVTHTGAAPASSAAGAPRVNNADPALIDTFIDFTGAERSVASEFMESAGWNLKLAVDQYMQRQEASGAPASQQQQQASQAISSRLAQPHAIASQAHAIASQAPAPAPPPAAVFEWAGVPQWLRSLGLEKYIATFAEQEITDHETVAELTDDDIKEIGITTIGARRKILASIRTLKNSKVVEVESAPEPTPDAIDLSQDLI